MRTAAYARFSTEMQRTASIDDQLRNVRAFCDARDWSAPVVYTDEAISGARNDRPGYLRLMADAQKFDVILVDDLSRLSRDSIEAQRQVKRLKFTGVRVICISDGIDTDDRAHKLGVGLKGLMGELYLDDLRDKTHRGLSGRALAGASAGGLPFGYSVAGVGLRAINDAQAAVVRRIFAEYVAGRAPRHIAADLNREGIRPARSHRSGGEPTWGASAIRGDKKRAIGILSNPIYVGRQIWNRSRWVKHPDTGRRLRKERPESEWIITEHPELAIVDMDTWNAAQRRARAVGAIYAPLGNGGRGRQPRHLLSGLLVCECCGGPIVICDRYRYGCSRNKERGDAVCENSVRFRRDQADEAFLSFVRKELLADNVFREYERAFMAEIRSGSSRKDEAETALTSAKRVHGNIMDALRAGIITPSTRAELVAAEASVAAAQATLDAFRAQQPSQFIPRLRERWRRLLEGLEERTEMREKRAALQDLFGERLVVRNEGGVVSAVAESREIRMVAGAGYVPYLTGTVRIPLQPSRE
jgi:site-specific DNA recombinase